MEDRTVIQPAAAPGSVRRGVRLNGIYELGPLIAHGGMGEVYRGFNIVTNDPVAIKMILPELSDDPEAFAMFKREASVLLDLHHEAIVRYFVFSVDPELRRAYLAMEFVDGPSLSKRLAQGPLPIEDVKLLQRRLADALETAHRRRVVHRDISSDNVILPGGDPRRAKLIDFGIARSLRMGEGTIIGSRFAGKYNYASPEQLGLEGGDVGPKSDIYSLGLVLAEALLGRPVDMGGSHVETIEKRKKVPDLSAIDPSMRPLIAAMLQPSPKDRPESMAAVAAWTPAAASGARPREPGAKESSAFGGLAAAAAALIVVVSVGGAVYAYRDLLPWPSSHQQATGQDTPAPPVKPQQQDANIEPGPHKPPPLPPLPTPDQTQSADGGTNAAPSLPPVTDTTNKPPPHVPTADELVNALKHQKKPDEQTTVVAVNSPPANDETKTNSEPSPVPGPKSHTPSSNGGASEQPTVIGAVPPIADEPAKPNLSPAPGPGPKTEPAPALRAARDQLTLDPATVGQEYLVDLPPFSAADPKGVALRVEPRLPEGLILADLGQGFGRISGAPSKPGQYSFSIVASDASGASARMAAQLAVAAAPAADVSTAPTPHTPQTVEPELVANAPVDKTAAFLRDFEGGPCFLTRALSGGSKPVILGVGADKAAFQRFYAGFNREVGVEPNLIVRLIAPSQCPAVDLIGANAKNDAQAPKIELASYDVGRSRPLAGSISNLDGRSLALLVVGTDGQVHRIEARPAANGSSATFSVPIAADAVPKDAVQVIVAIVSPKPLASLAEFKSGAAGAILPRVQSDLAAAGGSLETEFFKLVN